MSIKPKLCGKNRIQLPTSGCGDCTVDAISDEELESLTPIECYEDNIAVACSAVVCQSNTSCESSETESDSNEIIPEESTETV